MQRQRESSPQRDLKFHKLRFSIHVFLPGGEFQNGILK